LTRYVAAFTLACLSSAALLVAAQAQQPSTQKPAPPQAPARPTFKSEANYIRVDAFVTKDGRPVQDLTAEDFELLEDGKPQRIDAFEHVVIAPAGPQASRIEPNTQEAANQMAQDPRARVFVVFLDVDHVPVEGSFRLKTALATMLSRMLGQDDMLGVITSRNSPSELILARKTAYVEEQLEKYWYWGRRDSIVMSPEEEGYLQCYSRYQGGQQVAEEMIDRRREKLALDALSDLVIHLRGLRDERKAVLVISTGWPLFRPSNALERPLVDPMTGQSHIPGPPPVGVGPGGKIIVGDDPRNLSVMHQCDRDRMELANIDDWQRFRNLTQDANRANVSFYPVDPRGLVAFDSPIGPRQPPPPALDWAILRERQNNLRTMAEETDGLAVVNTSDLNAGLRRITDDLTSYYLLGYYTTNPALDGKYHRITVRVKRPGAEVRARKGYRAATPEEVARGAAVAAPPANNASTAAQNAIASALNRLALIRPDAALYINATHQPGGPVWVSGEVPLGAAKAAWAQGGRVSIMAVDASGATLGVARKQIAPGERDFIVPVPLDDPTKTPTKIQVRAEPQGAAAVGLEVAPRGSEPLLLRRTTTGAPHAAADFRYFRTETLVYRWTLAAGESVGGGRLLDRVGKPMAFGVTPAEESADGGRWLAGTLTLAPLTTGDYLLELTKRTANGEVKSLVPFRVVR
jgi:VWFA-related protein